MPLGLPARYTYEHHSTRPFSSPAGLAFVPSKPLLLTLADIPVSPIFSCLLCFSLLLLLPNDFFFVPLNNNTAPAPPLTIQRPLPLRSSHTPDRPQSMWRCQRSFVPPLLLDSSAHQPARPHLITSHLFNSRKGNVELTNCQPASTVLDSFTGYS
ncbi:MAG: hypothetical protein J3R72DRAFT_23736 [Linnemannia gamsii]|nr:MAG: hypothetical protein J3R72DRAFT_23736 [Linnemannia gamsii]